MHQGWVIFCSPYLLRQLFESRPLHSRSALLRHCRRYHRSAPRTKCRRPRARQSRAPMPPLSQVRTPTIMYVHRVQELKECLDTHSVWLPKEKKKCLFCGGRTPSTIHVDRPHIVLMPGKACNHPLEVVLTVSIAFLFGRGGRITRGGQFLVYDFECICVCGHHLQQVGP